VGIAAYSQREWGKKQKEAYLGQIRVKFDELRISPDIGVPRDDIAHGLRARPIGRHIIYYRATEAGLVVVRLLHQSMDPTRHLKG
jgi:toxin ParE1/3/4